MSLGSEESSSQVSELVSPESLDNLNSGVEKVRNFLKQLPPQGIAIQGTLLERAESIERNGFFPQSIKPDREKNHKASEGTWFYHLMPQVNPDVRATIKSIEEAIRSADGWANVRSKKALEKNSGKRALVVLIPPEAPVPSIWHEGSIEGKAYPSSLSYPVHKDWVLGVIPFPEPNIKEDYIGKPGELARKQRALGVMKEIAKLLEEKKAKIEEITLNPPNKANNVEYRHSYFKRIANRIKSSSVFSIWNK